MELESAKTFLLGALVMGDLVVALFFLRYWKVTGDRFFIFLSCSFGLGALSWALLAGNLVSSETEPMVYIIRLLSYFAILLGIGDANRASLRKAIFQRA